MDRQSFVTVLDGIRRLAGSQTRVLHAAGCGILDADLQPVPTHWLRPRIPQACLEQDDAASIAADESGLTGTYFNGYGDMRTPVLTRVDQRIQFNWIYSKPGDGVDADRFSVRWTGQLVPDRSFTGRLGVGGLDSMRLWVDGVLFVDTWERSDAQTHKPFCFEAGVAVDIRLEFQNDQRGAKVVFGFQEEAPDLEEAVRLAAGADVAVVCVGDNEDTCGENLDRADLDLPGRQAEMVPPHPCHGNTGGAGASKRAAPLPGVGG